MLFDSYWDDMEKILWTKDRKLTAHLKVLKKEIKTPRGKTALDAVITDLKTYPRNFIWEE